MKKINDLLGGLFSDREGVALITTLWILAMLSALVAAFSTNAILHTQMTDALTSMGQGYDIARAGMELWMGQLRADAKAEDQGIIMTEIMNYYPNNPVKINEVDAGGRCPSGASTDGHVEVFNYSKNMSLRIDGWEVVSSDGTVLNSAPSNTTLDPRETYVFSESSTRMSNTGDVVALVGSAGDTVDTFAYSSAPPSGSGESFQTLPDGWNGMKPAATQSQADQGWLQRSCSIGKKNGTGMWLKVGDASKYEGLQITQYDNNMNVIESFNFAEDDNNPVNPETHFLPIHENHDTGTAVFTNNIDTLANAYANGSDSALVVNMGGSLPVFSDTTMYVSINVPKPERGNEAWSEWWYSDTAALPGSTNWSNVDSLNNPGQHGYLVRYDTGLTPANNLIKGDSVQSKPDPGSWRPAEYINNSPIGNYKFTDSSSADGQLYISEMYDTKIIPDTPDQPVITAIDGVGEWVEIFNPSDDSYTLETTTTADYYGPQTQTVGGVTIDTGAYHYLCYDASCNNVPSPKTDLDALGQGYGMFSTTGGDGIEVVFTNNNTNDTRTDRVGWCDGDMDYTADPTNPNNGACDGDNVLWTPAVLEPNLGDPRFQRKEGPSYFDSNAEDFEFIDGSTPSQGSYDLGGDGEVLPDRQFVELLLYGPPEVKLPDLNEFVEIYNTGDTKDATSLSIQDQLPSSNSYDIVVHPNDPQYSGGGGNGDLASKQVGVVMSADGSPAALGISDRVDSGLVRLYSLKNSSGEFEFFTEGLSNDKMENLSINNTSNQTVLSSGSWDPPQPVVERSREKAILDAPDENDNWPLSQDGGTPGVVSAGDNFTDPWGWGGELFSGVSMYEKVYLPSMETSYQDGDIGYFEMRYIEDESGKQNILNPGAESYRFDLSASSKYTDGVTQKRLSTFDGGSKIVDFAQGDPYGDTWLTPGEFFTNDASDNNLISGSISTWERYRHILSGWRSGPSKNDININTAPYEALRGIPINSDRDLDPAYVSEEMALNIIEHRSGDPPVQDADGNYVIPLEDYTNDNENPFPSTAEACELSEMQDEENFDCSVFQNYTKVSSDGIFRANVKGVTLTDDGDTMNVTYLDVIVDRRPVEDGSGGLEIIYMRKN